MNPDAHARDFRGCVHGRKLKLPLSVRAFDYRPGRHAFRLAETGQEARVLTETDHSARLTVQVFDCADDIGRALARRITLAIAESTGPFVLGVPAGRSGTSVFAHLARVAGSVALDWRRLRIAMLDAYVLGAPGDWRHLPSDAGHSALRFAVDHILDPVNASLGRTVLDVDQVLIPDPNTPSSFESQLEQLGGFHHLLLASGSGDGHVGFNPPGSSVTAECRVVDLPASTRADNLRTYPFLQSVDHVPSHGVTVGIATIAAYARHATLLLPGAEKSQALRRVLERTEYAPAWPATVIHSCRRGVIALDKSCRSEALSHYLGTTTESDS